jgi:hypothetical protein
MARFRSRPLLVSLVALALSTLLLGGAAFARPLLSGGAAHTSPRIPATIRTVHATVPAHDLGSAQARCQAGYVVTGGGYELATINPAVNAFTNAPFQSSTRYGWNVSVINESGVDVDITAFAVCTPA